MKDVVFVVFGVDKNHAGDLANILRKLGFRLSGRHRRKPVERWSQGAINLLINCSEDGLARSHYVAHGSGVCAIALRDDDVHRTLARSQALDTMSFLHSAGTNEIKISEISGL